MLDSLQHFIPEASYDQVTALLSHDNLVVKVKQERKTRHGDYRRLPTGKHQITINSN
jgi:SprT protein